MKISTHKILADWRVEEHIVGAGLLATAFSSGLVLNRSVVVYASGVSRSDCIDPEPFARERALLTKTLTQTDYDRPFLYFGTCSAYDPDVCNTPYVRHKLAMEALVLAHPHGLVVRLPQVAGPSAQPKTLLASLVTSIRAGQEVQVWEYAVRNLVDVDDVVRIVDAWLTLPLPAGRIINVANPTSISVLELVRTIESTLGLVAKIKRVPKGASYDIDTNPMLAPAALAKVSFGADYLHRVIRKYFT